MSEPSVPSVPSVETELLAAIVAAPDDDAPRMVYADHLMQRGDPRGEFIALQCRLARADAEDQPIDDALVAREQELRAQYADTWTAPLRAIVPGAGYVFRRGFVEHASVWSELSLTHRLPSEVLPVETLDRTDRVAELVTAEALLRSIATNGELLYLAIQAGWSSLRAVTLYSAPPSEEHVLKFLRELRAVRRLQLTCASATDVCARTWLSILEPLEHLGFHIGWHSHARPDGGLVIEQLVANRTLHGLRSLHLGGFQLRDVRPLAGLAELERLALSATQVRATHVAELARRLPKLAMLEIDDAELKLGVPDFDELLSAAPIRRFALREAPIGKDGARALARSAAAASLRRLELDNCKLGNEGVQQLLDSPHLANLIWLRIRGEKLSPEILSAIEARNRLRYHPAPPGYPPEVMSGLPGNKILAIKEWRQRTNQGLADSKMAIERIMEEYGTYVPTNPSGEEVHGFGATNAFRGTTRWCQP